MKFFEFDSERDFPYYNNNPRISKKGWFVLILSIIVSTLLYIFISFESELAGSIVFCFGMLIPLLYYSNWDYTLIFRRPKLNEITLGFLMFVGYLLYIIVMDSVLGFLGFVSASESVSYAVNVEFIVSLVFSMMGEELLKFIPLMLFMRIVYKYSENRKLAIFISSVIVLVGFGLIHYDFTTSIIYVLLFQGFGTIFELYGYFKTKNLFVPYLSHILTDGFIFSLMLLGFS